MIGLLISCAAFVHARIMSYCPPCVLIAGIANPSFAAFFNISKLFVNILHTLLPVALYTSAPASIGASGGKIVSLPSSILIVFFKKRCSI